MVSAKITLEIKRIIGNRGLFETHLIITANCPVPEGYSDTYRLEISATLPVMAVFVWALPVILMNMEKNRNPTCNFIKIGLI